MESADRYVYLLIDTTDLTGITQGIFYVGKGTGGRFADHFDETEVVADGLAEADDLLIRSVSEASTGTDCRGPEAAREAALLSKRARIAELMKRPGTVRVDILRRGLTNDQALLLESATIDVLGLENLTNHVHGQHSYRQPLAAFGLSERASAIPLTDPAVLVPVSGIWAAGDGLEGLAALDDAAIWENARHFWAVGTEMRAVIRKLGQSSRPARLLAVHTVRLDDGMRTVLGGVVIGEWPLADAVETASGTEFVMSPIAFTHRYLHHRLLTPAGASIRIQQDRIYSEALRALRPHAVR